MTNYYKGLAFLALGNRDFGQVEFRRSQERTARAEEKYKRQADAANAAHADDPNFAHVLQTAQKSLEYQEAETHLAQQASYAPYENPFATYMAGIVSLTGGDSDKAIEYFGRAAMMLGPQSPAAIDLAWAEQNRGAIPPQVWVVFENGQSATFAEKHIVLPMVTGEPMILAVPVLMINPAAEPYLNVQSQGAICQTQPAGNFDAVIASEFQRQQPSIMAAAVAEVLAKNVASVIARKTNIPMLRMVTKVAENISKADTRSWTALPKEFQSARIPVPPDGRVTLTDTNGRVLGSVIVPAARSSIVYVKMQTYAATPALQVIKL